MGGLGLARIWGERQERGCVVRRGGRGDAAAGAWYPASRSASCDAAPHPTHMEVASAHHHTHRRAPVIGGAVTP